MTELREPTGFGDDFTTEHAQRMLDFYAKTLKKQGYEAAPYPDVDAYIGTSKLETPKFATLGHALWMSPFRNK